MLIRLVFAAILCSTLAGAAGPERRSGVWQTSFEKDGKVQHMRLILEIVHGGLGTTSSWVSSQGSLRFSATPERGATWQLVSSCGYFVEPQLQLAGDHLSFQCAPRPLQTAGRQPDHVSAFDGQFVQSYTRLSGTLRLDGGDVPVVFTKPQESGAAPLGGDWTASGYGQRCVLHIYDGSATIDVSSSSQAVFGQPVDITMGADGRIELSWADIGPISFVGLIDPQHRRFEGTWFGRGSRCSDDGTRGIFTRLDSN